MHISPLPSPIEFQCCVSSEATEIGKIRPGNHDLGLSSYVPIEIQLSSYLASRFVRSRICRGKKQRLPENEERAGVISHDSERGWICPEHSWCIDSISLESFPALYSVKSRSPVRPVLNIFLWEWERDDPSRILNNKNRKRITVLNFCASVILFHVIPLFRIDLKPSRASRKKFHIFTKSRLLKR